MISSPRLFVCALSSSCLLLAATARAAEDGCPTGALSVGVSSGGQRIAVARDGETLRLQLLGMDGQVETQQVLPQGLSCAELEAAVRVVLESWNLQLQPSALKAPSLPVEPAAPPPQLKQTVVPAPPTRWRAEVGAALSGSVTTSGPVAAALIVAALGSARRPLELQIDLLVEGSRQGAIGPGTFNWNRIGLALGPGYRWHWARWSVDVGVAGWASVLSASGAGVPNSQSSAGGDFGLGASVETALHFRHLAPFVRVEGLYWLPDAVAVQRSPFIETVPQWELLAGLGLRWTLG